MIRRYILFALLACCGSSYKFLVYSPTYGYSHTKFMGVLADILTEAGHNVTILMPIIDNEEMDLTGVKLTKNIIKLPPDERIAEMQDYEAQEISELWKMPLGISGFLQMKQEMIEWQTSQCERTLKHVSLIKQLEKEQFDVGIAEAFGICGFGVFRAAKIKTTLATLSSVHADLISEIIGEPVTPSYVPGGMSSAGDQMDIVGRFENFMDALLERSYFIDVFDSEIKLFKKKFGPDFDGWQQLLADTSLWFVNSNPYLDYPRPTLHRSLSIGGITVSSDHEKNELPEWDAFLNERNTTVLVSFGSVAKAVYMPDNYMQSLLKVFESMPETTFIFKYEEENSKIADHLRNVHLSTWLPQNALLGDPRLTAFITHGGLGSVTEVAYQDKPAILIPIFADQPRNAKMLAKHGGAIYLTKYDLNTPEKLKESLRIILNDPSYARNAKHLAEMLRNPPISSKQLFLRHCEFAAKFGRLPSLDPYGRQLSFVQYYLIDIALLLMAITAIAIYAITKVFLKCLSIAKKVKKD
ncbi:unnamed protein product [Cylicocyclus nassatus]|uniref:glucuronosyltransferase n=1 Tax=Cylicocyclus nassatus TaxID=53992 RepID=A0AA36H4P1_CYLNA|nr:unnamed protein product [Cylicocyclus nassatus]